MGHETTSQTATETAAKHLLWSSPCRLLTPLPRKLHFTSADKVVELVERGGGITDQESRLMLNQAITKGRAGDHLGSPPSVVLYIWNSRMAAASVLERMLSRTRLAVTGGKMSIFLWPMAPEATTVFQTVPVQISMEYF